MPEETLEGDVICEAELESGAGREPLLADDAAEELSGATLAFEADDEVNNEADNCDPPLGVNNAEKEEDAPAPESLCKEPTLALVALLLDATCRALLR